MVVRVAYPSCTLQTSTAYAVQLLVPAWHIMASLSAACTMPWDAPWDAPCIIVQQCNQTTIHLVWLSGYNAILLHARPVVAPACLLLRCLLLQQ
jgi:hypothetical protein